MFKGLHEDLQISLTSTMKILVTSDESMFGDNFHNIFFIFFPENVIVKENVIVEDIMETKFAFLTICLLTFIN